MNGAQDLGGMMGFGPVEAEKDEPLFHGDWEKRAMAITIATGACGMWNIDISRHARETLPPPVYLNSSYYEIWSRALQKLLVRTGMVTERDLAAGKALDAPVPVKRVLKGGEVAAMLAKGGPCDRAVDAPPAFAVGQRVRMKNIHPTGHTRLPRYVRGHVGIIEAVCGGFVYPDSNAHGKGEDPQWLYTVTFAGTELWGPDSDAGVSVSVDAFEPYLEAL